ncbi:hypothetical protein Esti_001444 [Eimeria stiedai]
MVMLFCLGAAALLAAALPALGCFQENTDYPGEDIAQLEGKVYSAAECQRQCQGVEGCDLFTFVPSTFSCYLKRGSAVSSAAEGLISGPRVCPGPVSCSQVGIDLFGGDIIDTEVANDRACQYQCTAVEGCRYYTYIPSRRRCYLKGENIEPRPHEEAISGPRVCPNAGAISCELHTDFMGHDLQAFYGTVFDVQSCQQLCQGFNNCFYFTFVESQASCYLKDQNAEEGREYNSATFSGARDCDLSLSPTFPVYQTTTTTTTTAPPPNCLLPNTDFPGSDLTAFGLGSVTKPEACQLLCQYTLECFYFTFFEGTCYFKTAGAIENVVAKEGAVSGPKYCSGTENITPPPTTTTTTTSTTTTSTTSASTSGPSTAPTEPPAATDSSSSDADAAQAPIEPGVDPDVDALFHFLKAPGQQ